MAMQALTNTQSEL
jgi:hypothetical protein